MVMTGISVPRTILKRQLQSVALQNSSPLPHEHSLPAPLPPLPGGRCRHDAQRRVVAVSMSSRSALPLGCVVRVLADVALVKRLSEGHGGFADGMAPYW
jgi:hypothetical protein